jgi:hypothetical protein
MRSQVIGFGSGSGDVPPERLYEGFRYICFLNRSLLLRRSIVLRSQLFIKISIQSLISYPGLTTQTEQLASSTT